MPLLSFGVHRVRDPLSADSWLPPSIAKFAYITRMWPRQ